MGVSRSARSSLRKSGLRSDRRSALGIEVRPGVRQRSRLRSGKSSHARPSPVARSAMSGPDARNVAIAQRRSRHRISRGELRPSLHRRNPSSSVPTSAADHNRAGRKTSRRSSSVKLRRHAIRIAKTTMTVAGAVPIRPVRRRTDRQPRIDPIHRGTATALGSHHSASRHAMGARRIRHASALVSLGGGRLANGVSARSEAVLSVSTR